MRTSRTRGHSNEHVPLVVLCLLLSGGCTSAGPGAGDASDAAAEGAAEAAIARCVPGYQVACACPGGGTGVQVCADDGQHFEPCQCAPPDSQVPSQTTAESGADATSADDGPLEGQALESGSIANDGATMDATADGSTDATSATAESGSGEAEAVDGASSDGGGEAAPCSGPVIQGTVTISNSLDIQINSGFSEITGDLILHAQGWSTLSLPHLCKVDGSITDDLTGSELTVIDLPSLVAVGSAFIISGPVTGFNVPRLASVGALGCSPGGQCALYDPIGCDPRIPPEVVTSCYDTTSLTLIAAAMADVEVPALVETPQVRVATSTDSLTLDAPSLATTSVVLTATDDVTLSAASLTSATSVYLGGAGALTISAPLTQVDALTLAGAATSTANLSSITSAGSISATGYSIALPNLARMSGELSVNATSLSAPLLTSIADGFLLQGLAALDFSSLEQVTGFPSMQYNGSALWGNTIAEVELPALMSANIQFGNGTGGGPMCIGLPYSNVGLVQIVAPNWKAGTVTFMGNCVLPKCRADALATQLGETPAQTELAYVTLATGPCP
jgi:hypothetical protein